MEKPVVKPQLDPSHWEPKFPFDLVVAYDDPYTRDRALQLYDHLAQQLLNDYDFQCSWWKFEHLQNPTLLARAADAAVEANMVILSLKAGPDLSPVHKAWLEDWIPRRDGSKAALVTLIAGAGDPQKEGGSMLAYLQNAARLGRMDFFTHGFDIKSSKPEVVAGGPARRVNTVPPVFHQVLQQPIPTPRWGINE